jgi:hypothetical protein
MIKRGIIAAAGLLAVSVTGGAAMALPAAGAIDLPQGQNLVEKAHGWHSSCQRGPAGWHYHSRRDGRVACIVRPPGHYWRWTYRDGRYGWWHWRDRRWR